MARNEEKHFGKLNRIILAKLKEDHRKKNPKRPRLENLDTVEEIQKWLPSISKELEFNLAQSKVSCYPERVIEGFHEKIDSLKREYQAFVRKLRSLDPSCTVTPWTERAYNKRTLKSEVGDLGPASKKKVQKTHFTSHTSSSEIPSTRGDTSEDSLAVPNVPCERQRLPLVNRVESSKNDTSKTSMNDSSYERLALPILHSQTEQLYREDKEMGTLEVTWNNESESETAASEKNTCDGLLDDARKKKNRFYKRFTSVSRKDDVTCETEECNAVLSSSSENTDHNLCKLESEYGFHNDKPLEFGILQKVYTNTGIEEDGKNKTISDARPYSLKPHITIDDHNDDMAYGGFSGIVGYSSSDED